ncbi:MAG: hypothetical protein NXY57DRAFT_969260 [Lentinula lateritia]|nr:MAG: hypothetical protein NXY57DRAFT_969260 [Lentinula lateritia]
MATNSIETLDPALIRPACIIRSVNSIRHIVKLRISTMSLPEDTDLEEFVMWGMTYTGLLALRERRTIFDKADFSSARERHIQIELSRSNTGRSKVLRKGLFFPDSSIARLDPVVGSTHYCGSNEAPTWRDIDFYLNLDEDVAHSSFHKKLFYHYALSACVPHLGDFRYYTGCTSRQSETT